jgi:hypothetical protein
MSSYAIEYDYTTGDSFGHTDLDNQVLEHSYEKYDTAVENVNRLAEHYKLVAEYDSYYTKTRPRDEILADVAKQRWAIPNMDCWQFSVILINDAGETFACHVPWTGYFETLHSLRVTKVKSEMHRVDF